MVLALCPTNIYCVSTMYKTQGGGAFKVNESDRILSHNLVKDKG